MNMKINNTKPMMIAGLMMAVSASPVMAAKFKYIDLREGGGIYPNDGIIKVNNNGNGFSGTDKQSVSYHMELKAGCGTGYHVDNAMVKYGSGVSVSTDNVLEADGNYNVDIYPGNKVKDMGYKEAVLNIPVNKLDQNPVEACQNLMNEKLSQGVTKAQFMASEHVITLPAPMTGLAHCAGNINSNNGQWGYDHYLRTLKVVCKKGSVSGINDIKAKTTPIAGADTIAAKFAVSQASFVVKGGNMAAPQVIQCPGKIDFTGSITATGKGTVKYKVNFPGTSNSEIRELEFDKAGTKSIGIVQYTVTQNMPVASAMLQILAPTKMNTYANFKVACKSSNPDSINANPVVPKLGIKVKP